MARIKRINRREEFVEIFSGWGPSDYVLLVLSLTLFQLPLFALTIPLIWWHLWRAWGGYILLETQGLAISSGIKPKYLLWKEITEIEAPRKRNGRLKALFVVDSLNQKHKINLGTWGFAGLETILEDIQTGLKNYQGQ